MVFFVSLDRHCTFKLLVSVQHLGAMPDSPRILCAFACECGLQNLEDPLEHWFMLLNLSQDIRTMGVVRIESSKGAYSEAMKIILTIATAN
jgi:hypothetical protein